MNKIVTTEGFSHTVGHHHRKSVSWSAVLAGVAIALVCQLALSLLGIVIGASTIDPFTDVNPGAGVGAGTAIWLLIASLLSLFTGGWVSGRLSGNFDTTETTLHGILTWALTTLVAFYLVTTTLGTLVSGAAGVFSKGVSLAGQGVSAAAPQLGNLAQEEFRQISGIDIQNIKNEVTTLLRQTGKQELQPESLDATATNLQNEASQGAARAGQNPQASDKELQSIFSRVVSQAQSTINAADKSALINILISRSNMSQQEATETVNRWEDMYKTALAEFEKTKNAAIQGANEAADVATTALTKTALLLFIILILSLIAAALGGKMATSENDHTTVAIA
jgi:hypothetical protein